VKINDIKEKAKEKNKITKYPGGKFMKLLILLIYVYFLSLKIILFSFQNFIKIFTRIIRKKVEGKSE